MVSSDQQLSEYETELADIKELLAAEPTDESLISLKNDLEELIALTKAETSGLVVTEKPTPTVTDEQNLSSESPEHTTTASTQLPVQPRTAKSKKKPPPTSFEIPLHLLSLPSDSESERNRKRRAAKALKSKWRERVKEVEGSKKQKQWKDFVSKGKKRNKVSKKESIFRTEEGVQSRVGVIGSGKSMTEFGGRKRFKTG